MLGLELCPLGVGLVAEVLPPKGLASFLLGLPTCWGPWCFLHPRPQ